MPRRPAITDRLFAGNRPRLRQADLREYAEEIGVSALEVALATPFVENRVEADVISGDPGTSTRFVDGRPHRGAGTVGALRAGVDAS
jgi:hypothetical protein